MPYDDPRHEEEPDTPVRKRKRRWLKRLGWALAAVVAVMLAGALFLGSPIGKRFVANQIAEVSPASGLRFSVGRIEGDIYAQATLHDVVLSDPKGVFLRIPEVVLDWNPLAWLTSGLDVRELTAKRGTLERLPELLPGDPDAPVLPDFDIRIDRFAVEGLTLAPGVLSDEAERVDLSAEVDIRSGRVFANAKGQLGRQDSLALLIEAEPDGDVFDLSLAYDAPRDGVLARLTGAEQGYTARLEGDGTWSEWVGHLLVKQDDARVAGFRVTNRSGQYGVIGRVTPAQQIDGLVGRAIGSGLSLKADGTLEESTFDGSLRIVSTALSASGEGAVDLAGNAFDDFDLTARLRDPALFGESLVLNNTRLTAELNGAFRDLEVPHELRVGELVSGETVLATLAQDGTARFDGSDWRIPLNVTLQAIETGNATLDDLLKQGALTGDLTYSQAGLLISDNLSARFPQLRATSTLRGDPAAGTYALAGEARGNGLALDGFGQADANAKFRFNLGSDWKLAANFAGRMTQVSNNTVQTLAGDPVAFRGGVTLGSGQPILLRDLNLTSDQLQLALSGSVEGDRTVFSGSGAQANYGAFTVDGAITGAGPEARLVLAEPFPAAGIRDVTLALAPSEQGFAIDAEGQSLLGTFDGVFDLVTPAEAPARLAVESLRVSDTQVAGALDLLDGGARGNLRLSGGGLDGTIGLAPQPSGQAFTLNLQAKDARFSGATPIRIGSAVIDAQGSFGEQGAVVTGDLTGRGISYGTLQVGRVAAKADWNGERGSVTGSVTGRRGSRFALDVNSTFSAERIAAIARGELAGRTIAMPRAAVLTAQEAGGWRLAPSRLDIGQGRMLAEGVMGGPRTSLSLKLSDMPLSLADLAVDDLGFGGTVSGIVEFEDRPDRLATGNARLRFNDLTRSGLVLSSPPLDVAVVSDLQPGELTLQGLISDDSKRLGQIRARVSDLNARGSLWQRLQAGRLNGALRYDGSAAELWRLAAIDAFDLTGPVEVTASATGTLADPQVRGNLSSDSLRVRSGLSGTDVRDASVRGSFAGSTLRLTRFAGEASNGGKVSGSGTVDLANLSASRGPGLDIKIAADNANLLDAAGLSATITGPLRIVSDGRGGTIAGRVRINRASWKLGTAAEDVRVPSINTREINRDDSETQTTRVASPWRYLIDASTRSRIDVDGMGLDSEWGADIVLRGTTDDPRIGGEARIVRGFYSFAGTRFEITRGRIEFDENQPIDPRLDILAETDQNGLDVSVSVQGNALEPRIAFNSNPAMPEEEILSRLLFGDSITSLSATDALQLGTALASLRGGSGLDPINQLRSAIGLDRLRIVSADPALDRGTGVALGKNLGKRFYIELVTDGRAYSATSVEFRVTSWLSLLGSVSTIGRDSVVAEVSRDY
ncbi:translocation/assembly module TamB domain-containing protein [Altererythrobacter lutimaris]|uniref:Translocation/assembly module TamB domain-containing protein n=1 Tax=Altererythrobacter lutimaris TaxID=2743979 RepID=A0A850H9W1_9SPHN|nr:translocation/assembly module TamB domain-containing protein [Altererythrobacter lutimaris]NVE94723.1 translocation/assembly module TamB domain-containing protein [Altererythrobacter lutimaris]